MSVVRKIFPKTTDMSGTLYKTYHTNILKNKPKNGSINFYNFLHKILFKRITQEIETGPTVLKHRKLIEKNNTKHCSTYTRYYMNVNINRKSC